MRYRAPAVGGFVVVVVAFMLLAAGCGGGGGSPGVASVASPPTAATTTTSATQSGSRPTVKALGPVGGGQGGEFQLSMNVGNATDGAKYSACMRKNGVTNFPDPNSQGVITIDSGMGIDPGSPAFISARSLCQKLLPNGGQPTPAQLAQRQQQMLAFSVCMRAHGIKDFPDPSSGGIRLRGGPGSDLDPTNPTFQRAQQACQKDLPFKNAPGTAKAGSGGGG
jgi:hypothetical protein